MGKERILVSSCFLGMPTRYDGQSRPNAEVIALSEKYELIPFCPEIYGGLPTPRTPAEIVGESVMMEDGTYVTEQYMRGARAAYELCLTLGIRMALLKARSPSCGYGEVYDGSFTHTLREGNGITAQYLSQRGIKILNEYTIDLIDKN